ncbi:MAG TPA: prepilin-type N-terminal cleavage/methylation domain-containing protein [Chthoniobacterales bacterium]
MILRAAGLDCVWLQNFLKRFRIRSYDGGRMQTASPHQSTRSSRRPAFTLVEMLVVIGIISLLLVAVIPAVNSLSKSNGRKAAISNFINAVEQARALAITSGSATYVVFGDETLTSPDDSSPDRYRAKAYIIFQDKNFVPVAVSKWYFLPTGISFLPGSSANSGLMMDKDPTIKFSCPGSVNPAPVALPFIKFDPNGTVAFPTEPNIMFVKFFSGFVTGAGQTIFTDKTQKTIQNFDAVTISRLTGRARYVDPYTRT